MERRVLLATRGPHPPTITLNLDVETSADFDEISPAAELTEVFTVDKDHITVTAAPYPNLGVDVNPGSENPFICSASVFNINSHC